MTVDWYGEESAFDNAFGWAALKIAVPNSDLRTKILTPFAGMIATSGDLETVFSQCARICRYYDLALDDRRWQSKITTKEIKARLNNINTTIRRLRGLLKDGPLLSHLCTGTPDEVLSGKPFVDFFSTDTVKNMLSVLERNAERMLEDDQHLNWLRGNFDRKWYPERSFIWEPFFDLVFDHTGIIPASRNGPVISAIRALHGAINEASDARLNEPVIESVYLAIREFNARRLAAGEN